MTFADLFGIISAAELSPEKAAGLMGVSGMTLRRWKNKTGDAPLPPLYAHSCAHMTSGLIASGRLSPELPAAKAALAHLSGAIFNPCEATLGLPPNFLRDAALNSDTMVTGLSQIGANPEHREEVELHAGKILSFKKWGTAWNRCISGMVTVVKSDKLTIMDKLVAYGALFYLLTPVDIIPDAIPVIGYMDDFAILSMALMYYESRFKKLFPAQA
jgi:uncharacterized membrane protein YkvA (DUF1232 family)